MTLKSGFFCLMIVFYLMISCAGKVRAEDLSAAFELNAGYRVDNLRWNIAGDLAGENPNILSELTWTDLQILQINALATVHLSESSFLQGSMNYGFIIRGNNQDSDYSGDDRTGEFSRSNNNGNGDNVMDISIAIGHYLSSSTRMFRIAPLIGYSFNQQNLRMTDGYQTISDPDYGTPDIGPFSGLNSTYKASWSGPWIGAGLTGNLNPEWTISGDFGYHWVSYYGEGNWNLRDNLAHPVSFVHYTDGNGFRWSAGTYFNPNPQLHLTLKYYSAVWSTRPGIDRVFGANGATGTTRFNEVVRSSQALMLTVRWKP